MELQIFQNSGYQIRGGLINNEPYFVAKDICEALAITNVSQAISRLDEDEKGIYKIDTLGGSQELWHINESGLYALVLSSNKLEAKAFKKWVTSEVLPTIRKTGAYVPRTPSEQIHLLAQGYTHIEQVVNEVKADVETLKNDIMLTSAQKRAIQNAVSSKVYSFDVLVDKKKTSALFKRVYKALKDRFAVSSYMEIRRIDYDEAKSFVDRLTLMDLVVGVEK